MPHPLIEVARLTLINHLSGGNTPLKKSSPTDHRPPLGCFVSLKIRGRLRGCVGTLKPVAKTMEEEVAANTLAAALRDPRFEPLRQDELDQVSISIDLLSPMEPVTSREELDPARYGLVVKAGSRMGVLLPDLPGVPSVEKQIEICLEKAEIKPTESIQMERFTVERISE